MTFDAIMSAHRTGKLEGLYDVVQMLSGAALVLFMWMHMILVASIILGAPVMNAIAEFFERTGMAQIGGPVIFLVFIAHFLLAVRKVPIRLDGLRTFLGHARALRHQDTWLWLVQIVTALFILLMGAIHMWVVLTDLPITAAKSAARVRSGFWLPFYLVLLPMIELHVGVGFYRIGVKWGLVKDKDRVKLKRGENILTLTFIGIGVLALMRFWFLN
jgi:fumarate reductase subunit C